MEERVYASVKAYIEESGEADRDIIWYITFESLKLALENLRDGKPNDRTGLDRCWAIAITGMQKVLSMFRVYCCSCEEELLNVKPKA